MPIHRLTPDQSEDMAALHALGFPGDGAWPKAYFSDLLSGGTGIAYGAFDLQQLVCMAVFQHMPPEAELLTLCSHPRHLRQGHARRLLDHALEDLHQMTSDAVHLEVAAENDAAIRLYKMLGFEQTGCRKAYYRRTEGPDGDALQFTRNIARQP